MTGNDLTDKELFRVLDEYNDLCTQEAEKQEQQNKDALHDLRKFVSVYKAKQVAEYFFGEDGDGIDWFLEGLVGKTEIFGGKQEEGYWFKYVYLHQITGPLGDDFTGTIFIPIIDGLFLKATYSC